MPINLDHLDKRTREMVLDIYKRQEEELAEKMRGERERREQPPGDARIGPPHRAEIQPTGSPEEPRQDQMSVPGRKNKNALAIGLALTLMAAIWAAAAMLTAWFAPRGAAAGPAPAIVTIKVNGQVLATSKPAIVKNGITYVPVRAVAEALGATVDWRAEEQVVGIDRGQGKRVYLFVGGGGQAYVDQGTTMVPVRFVSESLGALVDWDVATRTVIISYGSGGQVAGGQTSVTVSTAPDVQLPAPTGLRLVELTDDHVTIAWDPIAPVAGAYGYSIEAYKEDVGDLDDYANRWSSTTMWAKLIDDGTDTLDDTSITFNLDTSGTSVDTTTAYFYVSGKIAGHNGHTSKPLRVDFPYPVRLQQRINIDPNAQVLTGPVFTYTQPQDTPGQETVSGKVQRYFLSFPAQYYLPVIAGLRGPDKFASVKGMIDSGAAMTIFPDDFLRKIGYKPDAGPDNVRGIGQGPLKAYYYSVDYPYIYDEENKRWVKLGYGALKVMGVVGWNQVLIGPDILRRDPLSINGSTWELTIPPPER